jgi:hypothetical protein
VPIVVKYLLLVFKKNDPFFQVSGADSANFLDALAVVETVPF